MFRWKVTKIRKLRKIDFQRAKSVVGVANSRLRLLETQDAVFALKIKFGGQKWVPKDVEKSIFEGLISKRFFKRFSRSGVNSQGVRAPGSGGANGAFWGWETSYAGARTRD